ncbi:thioredoxin family protein [Agromyces indicus]|uniref:Thioredoxin family protein n=1 Tax=Agromyces indicus TaxID=758919 RepID=A0ABU1FFX7_9MICO|nr:thioredoxin family protein [Agromyces indicus]MDR5690657.1 thioredoxin family protein [Agromyces indicus]
MRARVDGRVVRVGWVLLLTGALALTGCATTDASGAGADPSATSRSDAMTSEPMDDASQTPEASAEPMDDAAAAPAEGAYLEYEDGAIEATAGPKALFFHASWCPKCRALDEDLKAQGAPDGLTVFKVDCDSRTDLRQKYGVTLQTTIVFVDDAGEKISSVVLYDDPSVESLTAAMP